ncbi:MAG: amidophosphoribosyltransferase [Deltaproteobacteria bacterium]|nr:amidophosphoribosyltransferase [Deltaproteobacteria bacterium]
MEPKLKEECGVFGVFNHPEAAHMTYLGLYALQHRGQEGAGIVACDGKRMRVEKGLGLVNDVFKEEHLQRLKGTMAVGHVRYSTCGDDILKNVQPFLVNIGQDKLAIAHNGNLTNAVRLKRILEQSGSIFQTTSDTEILLHLIARSQKSKLADRIVDALNQAKGAFSLLFLSEKCLIAVRDPFGFRPLCLGDLNGSAVFASETAAFDLIGAKFLREVEPGEMVIVDESGIKSLKLLAPSPLGVKQCIFEHIYFSRPDSVVFGSNVYEVRKALGRQLAMEHPAPADIVVPVPDSGVPAAIGYAEESKIPFQMGIIRNHYIGRTFIEPEQSIRNFGVKIKLNPIREVLEGKSVALVDDSIVRGTTSRKIVQLLRQHGAREVHLRISSPPTIGPCFYGIDTPHKSELIASLKSMAEIRDFIGADSLGYLSLEGLLHVEPQKKNFCTACFDDRYPLHPED